MKRSILWGCFFFSILGSLIFIQTGCDFFKNSPSGPSIVNSLADSSAVASVRFELVVPHKGDGTPLASIRGASNTSVTFRLVIARPGDTTRTKDVLVKSVAVGDDGSATVTFSNVPERPCVGQLSISNGNYQGYKDFHGALDLKEGENTIELAPAGSKLPQDILAHTAIVAFDSTELMQTANNALIQTINNSIIGIDATKDDVYTTSVNKAIEVLRPSTVTYFAISDDKKSLMGYANGVKNWENTTSDYFQSVDLWATNISDMYIKEIIRQNLGGVGYVAWKHNTLSPFAIGAITSSGSLQAFVKNPGVCEQILALSDGSVVIGGANDDKGCPVLFRWSGKENGSTWSNSGGAESGLIWYYYFTEQTFSGSGDRPTVKGLQFDGVDTLIVTVDNVEDNSVRTYRISLSSGSVLDQQTEKPNEFPSVVLQSPENGATFSVGDEIVFEAVASDTDGTIAKVEFYAGNSKVGEATSNPYNCSTTSLIAGTYSLSAIAIDNKGAKTRSTFSEIVVNSSSSGATTEIDLGDGIKMSFVPINAGSFTMGSPDTDSDALSYPGEHPQRVVTICQSLYMGKYEVTQAQYQKIMGSNPSDVTTDSNLPVENVIWYDAVFFCNKLSINQGLTPCYTDSDGNTTIDNGDTVSCNWSANGYRLPTEAEWEYCCRAGTTTKYSCGDTFDGAYGWYSANSSDAAHTVGTTLANPWGLHDMHGNVWEWCWDWFDYDYYSQGENSDPRGPSTGSYRVLRGVCCFYDAAYLRSSFRFSSLPTRNQDAAVGFRVLRLQNSNSVGLPASPSGLSATAGDKSVTLSWDSVSGANSYNIYYSTSSGVTATNGTKLSGKTSPFIHSGLTNGTTYYYAVATVNSVGESGISAEKSATSGTIEIDLGDEIKMNFVAINAGSFTMGSPNTDSDAAEYEKPQRAVTISQDFFMGECEVTQTQYLKIMGTNPSDFNYDSNLPVEQVSWYDTVSFCNKLSINQNLTPCYTNSLGNNTINSSDTVICDWSANGYRLPTEAEWEYCCRAGTTTIYCCGDTFDGAYGWYVRNSPNATRPVGTKLANPWRLHDMHGNVWEWCWDWYGSLYYSQNVNMVHVDPCGPPTGERRVVRGGYYYNNERGIRSGCRNSIEPAWSLATGIGFRVLRIKQ